MPPLVFAAARPLRWSGKEVAIQPLDLFHLVLVLGLIAGAVTDLRHRKIPNKLTGPLMLIGLGGNAILESGLGLQEALIGWLVAFVVHFGLTALGLEGAGDGKMMMAVGAFLGWSTMLEATLWRYLMLLPYGAVALTVMGRWGSFKDAGMWVAQKAAGQPVGDRPPPTKLPFGPVIAFVVPLAMQTDWLKLW